jgi:hypothetical protein
MADFLPTNQLDFLALRDNLKTFLQSNTSPFKDYDFDGSNLSTLLDLLSYNSYLNAFYLNMVGNEMFLDTAILRESAVSHAKALNYNVRSSTSAKATISLQLGVSNNSVQSVIIPKFTRFSASSSVGAFSFSTGDSIVMRRNDNNQFIGNIDIYEGVVVTEKFVANTLIANQRFVLSNKQVDTSSLQVSVAPTVNSPSVVYLPTSSLFGLNNTSEIYFVQPNTQDRYEIVFGDGIFGKKLTTGNVIEATYRITSGPVANGLRSFTPTAAIQGYTANVVSTIDISAGGADRESLDSIKFNAPRHFQTQERAVTVNDYKTLLLGRYPQLKSVFAFGGEDIPLVPRYGTVAVCVSTTSGNPLTETVKADILRFLNTRSPLSINPFLVDPEYLDLIVTSDITYNSSITQLTPVQITNIVNSTITTFNSNNLLEFNKPFRYSRLVSAINAADNSIVSNETSVTMVKTVTPVLGIPFTAVVDFGNPIRKDDILTSRPLTNEFTLYSSEITFNSRPAYIAEDGNGRLFVYEFTSTGRNVLNDSIGTVDYDTGVVAINNLVITNFVGDGIKFYAGPRKQDIFCVRNNIIRILSEQNTISINSVLE